MIIVSVYVHVKIKRTVIIELDNTIIKIYLQSLVGIVMSCPFTTKNNKLKMINEKFIFLAMILIIIFAESSILPVFL